MSRKPKLNGKQKVSRAALKRFKITGTGKVIRRSQNMRHIMRHKSKKAIRAARVPKQIKGKFAKKIKQLLSLA